MHNRAQMDAAAAVSYAPHFGEMKRYVRFDETDAQLLRALRPHAEPHFEKIVREFYERAREHEGAHEVFESEAQIGRLHSSLIAWLGRILTGPYDNAYCAKSARIGEVHVRVGLPQRYMFTAMNLFRVRLEAIAFETMQERALATTQALTRILDLELAIMNQTYRAAFFSQLERIHEHARPGLSLGYRYRAAIDLADIFLVGVDASGTILLFNATAERLTGYRADEVLGMDFASTFLVEGEHEWQSLLARVLASEERIPLSPSEPCCTIRTRNGRLRELHSQLCRAEEGDDGVKVLLVARDVTDERAAEATRTRTEKLAAVGTMAAGLAHEIRNPLNGAQLHLTYMRRALTRRDAMPDLLEAVNVVSNEVRRLSALVNDFLSFARPAPVRYEPVSLQQLCRHTSRMVDGASSSVELSLQLPETELVIAGDAAKLEQVLLNLLTNAMEAVTELAEGGLVILKAYRRPRAAIIEVRDNGPGFDGSAPIFDVFFSTKPTGTGLGLAIAHRIVDDHGGQIECSSKPGDTQFRVTLPLRASVAVD